MKRYGIWNTHEDVQEVTNISEDEVICFADTERAVNTNHKQTITTLNQAQSLLESIGYVVEKI